MIGGVDDRARRADAGTAVVRLRGQDGSVTIWMLGLAIALLFLGGLAVDLWRGFADRRELAGAVDAAAVAGASAIDRDVWRGRRIAVLETSRARRVACDYLRRRVQPPLDCSGIAATSERIRVTAQRDTQVTLVRVLLPDTEALTIEVSAVARARAR